MEKSLGIGKLISHRKIKMTSEFRHPFGKLNKGETYNVTVEELSDGETIAYIKYNQCCGNSSISVTIPEDYFDII